MSNNEVFETIFRKISVQIIDNNFKDYTIVNLKNKKYKYSNKIKLKDIINLLKNNLDYITNSVSSNLLIFDKKSVKKVLQKHFESDQFKKNLNKLTLSFISSKKIPFQVMKKIYVEHLMKYLMNNSVIEQILALSPELDFRNWAKRRWKIILLGYLSAIVFLVITFYVFRMD